MTYFRLVVQDRHNTHWIWKTTAVTSLQAVLHLLRNYRMLPQDGIRVLTTSSKEELSEMLRRQNTLLVPGSVTAAQFLQARKFAGGEPAQSTSKERVSPQTVQQGTDTATWGQSGMGAQREHLATAGVPSSLTMSMQERKRLEMELGPGGDHETPYLFTLPISQKERLAWIRLQKQVQAGELLS